MLRLLAVLSFLAALLCSGNGRADAHVVLVDPDPELENALRVALAPWATRLVALQSGQPGNTMPGSAERARSLAERSQADAVVWVSRSDEGPAIWIYDARDDRVMARKLPASPPFDEARAAAVALMVKTLLRYSEVPPPVERVQPLPSERWLNLGFLGGARIGPTGTSPDLRLAVAFTAFPPSFPGGFGVGLELGSGPGQAVDHELFTGRRTESSALLQLHGRLRVHPSLDVAVILGAGLEITAMSGAVVGSPNDKTAVRANPLAGVHVEAGWRALTGLRLALRVGGLNAFRTQTYVVHGEQFLEVRPWAVESLLLAEMGLF